MRPFEYSDLMQTFATREPGPDAEPPRPVQGFSSLHPIMRLRQWADRRLGLRRRTRIPATVHTGKQILQGTICDVSAGGVGIGDVEGLSVGDLITISIGPFMTLRGEVKWCRADRCGVLLIPIH